MLGRHEQTYESRLRAERQVKKLGGAASPAARNPIPFYPRLAQLLSEAARGTRLQTALQVLQPPRVLQARPELQVLQYHQALKLVVLVHLDLLLRHLIIRRSSSPMVIRRPRRARAGRRGRPRSAQRTRHGKPRRMASPSVASLSYSLRCGKTTHPFSVRFFSDMALYFMC